MNKEPVRRVPLPYGRTASVTREQVREALRANPGLLVRLAVRRAIRESNNS
jgi:hypothetical protein